MPRFIPDVTNGVLGRPGAMWFTPAHDRAIVLARTSGGQWVTLEVPTPQELAQYPVTFDSGRENHVTYQQVRDWNLTSLGRVVYVDDYDDQYTDVYISKTNTPLARATTSEPVWSAQ
jgi:hypothetical protein